MEIHPGFQGDRLQESRLIDETDEVGKLLPEVAIFHQFTICLAAGLGMAEV
jgi:hypothetical protein